MKRHQYNTVIANSSRTLTNLSHSATNPNGAGGYKCISHGIPENNTGPFQSSHTDCEEWDFHHRESTRTGNRFHNTHPRECSNNVFHACNPSENNQHTLQNVRPTAFKGNSLPLVIVEQTILEAALASIEMFNGTENNSETWIEDLDFRS